MPIIGVCLEPTARAADKIVPSPPSAIKKSNWLKSSADSITVSYTHLTLPTSDLV